MQEQRGSTCLHPDGACPRRADHCRCRQVFRQVCNRRSVPTTSVGHFLDSTVRGFLPILASQLTSILVVTYRTVPLHPVHKTGWTHQCTVCSWSWLQFSPRGLTTFLAAEDCLYLNIYAPVTARVGSNLPILVWIHGGSYHFGSTSDPGLDGSYFAETTNSIVITIQYRLGVLGYLPPTASKSSKNLGVQDVIAALRYVNRVAASFGGDKNRVTVAGQSSGGNMVRNLLAAPCAANYFNRAILQSDPIVSKTHTYCRNYNSLHSQGFGFLSTSTFTTLQSYFYGQLSCGDCLSTPLPDIINAQKQLIIQAVSIDPSTGFAEPIRPVLDGSLLTSSLTTTFPSNLKPILLTTVKDEALTSTYQIFKNPVPAQYFQAFATLILGAERAAIVSNTTFYPFSESDTDVRDVFAAIGTDELWKCAGRTFARAWAARGGTAYVGEFTLGATHPVNQDTPGCTSGGVCHQDDIFILFGTTPNPSAAQTSLTAEVQARWSAFMRGNTPNVSGQTTWNPVSSSGSITPLNLGGTSAIAEGPCTPSFWGSLARFDYQVFNQ